jgi:hypothetical protein
LGLGRLTLSLFFGFQLSLAELPARAADIAGDLRELAATDHHNEDNDDHVPQIRTEKIGNHAGFSP